jgi:hypothetical protein
MLSMALLLAKLLGPTQLYVAAPEPVKVIVPPTVTGLLLEAMTVGDVFTTIVVVPTGLEHPPTVTVKE